MWEIFDVYHDTPHASGFDSASSDPAWCCAAFSFAIAHRSTRSDADTCSRFEVSSFLHRVSYQLAAHFVRNSAGKESSTEIDEPGPGRLGVVQVPRRKHLRARRRDELLLGAWSCLASRNGLQLVPGSPQPDGSDASIERRDRGNCCDMVDFAALRRPQTARGRATQNYGTFHHPRQEG